MTPITTVNELKYHPIPENSLTAGHESFSSGLRGIGSPYKVSDHTGYNKVNPTLGISVQSG